MTAPSFRNDRVQLIWRRDGGDWRLFAILSWSKNAVLVAAECDGREFEVPGEPHHNLAPASFAAILNKLRAAP